MASGAGGCPIQSVSWRLMELDSGKQLELLIRLAVAVGLTAVVGLEREIQQEEAGLRTHTLVGLGAAAFTVLSTMGFPLGDGDPTRVAAGIVTGIGFIGAGTILRHGGAVRGLSTAASLWAVGAIGMAAGAGLFVFALGTMLLAVFVLEVLERLEQALIRDRLPLNRPPGDGSPLS
jgi:putative Mg2+ transporter-C (MgtC) family protein